MSGPDLWVRGELHTDIKTCATTVPKYNSGEEMGGNQL